MIRWMLATLCRGSAAAYLTLSPERRYMFAKLWQDHLPDGGRG